jgi:hypothetical protein
MKQKWNNILKNYKSSSEWMVLCEYKRRELQRLALDNEVENLSWEYEKVVA